MSTRVGRALTAVGGFVGIGGGGKIGVQGSQNALDTKSFNQAIATSQAVTSSGQTAVQTTSGIKYVTNPPPPSPPPPPNIGGGGGGSSGGGSSGITAFNNALNNKGMTTLTNSTPPATGGMTSSNLKNFAVLDTHNSYNVTTLPNLNTPWDVDPSGRRNPTGTLNVQGTQAYNERNKLSAYNSNKITPSQTDINKAFAGGKGTANLQINQPISDKQLGYLASTGDTAAATALVKRYEEKNQGIAANLYNDAYNSDKQTLDKYSQELQTSVNKGEISVEQANDLQNRYANTLDTNRQKYVTDKLAPLIKAEDKYLKKVATSSKVTGLVVATASSVVLGLASAPLLAAAPKVVQTGLTVAGGVGMGLAVSRDVQRYATGKGNVLDSLGIIVPAAGFIAGAGIGAKIFNVKGRALTKEQLEINNALQSPETNFKLTDLKKLTTEAQIKAQKFTPEQEAELIRKIQLGESIYLGKWELYSDNPRIQELIKNPNAPKIEITSFGDSQSVNQISMGNSFVKTSVIKGKFEYTDLTGNKVRGVTNPQTGMTISDVISIKAQIEPARAKPIIEYGKSTQVTPKPKVTYSIDKLGNIQRTITSETFSFEGKKAFAKAKEGITFKDLTDVKNSAYKERFASSKVSSTEVQELTGMKLDTAQLSKGDSGINLLSKELNFKTVLAEATSKKIPKPIEYDKVINRKMKPLEYPQDIMDSIIKSDKNFPRGYVEKVIKDSHYPEGYAKNKKFFETLEESKKLIESPKNPPSSPRNKIDIGINTLSNSLVSLDKSTSQSKVIQQLVEKKSPSMDFIQNLQLDVQGARTSIGKGLTELEILGKNQDLFGPEIIFKDKIKIGLRETLEGPKFISPIGLTELQEETMLGLKYGTKFAPLFKTQSLTMKQLILQKQLTMAQTKQFKTQQLQQQRITQADIFKIPTLPRVPPPVIIPPFVFPKLGLGHGQPKGTKKRKLQEINPIGKYTASLGAAAFQIKPIKVTQKQYDILAKRTYSGIEARPLLEIVSDNNKDAKFVRKELQKVKF